MVINMNNSIIARLPDKPSELIRLAIKDLNLAKDDSLTRISMLSWYGKYPDGTCVVCLAGAVIKFEFSNELEELFEEARRFENEDSFGILYEEINPAQLDADSYAKLIMLNLFRHGQYKKIIQSFNSRTKSNLQTNIPDGGILFYSKETHSEFCTQMLELANKFEVEGN